MAKKLDKERDYAVIVGDDQGRLYEQDSLYFGSDGSEWVEPGKRKSGATKPPAPQAEPAVAADQLARQLGL